MVERELVEERVDKIRKSLSMARFCGFEVFVTVNTTGTQVDLVNDIEFL